MASMDNYYQILDVLPNADIEQIKKAYRKKAKQYHPDICKDDDAQERFVLINEAYEYLVKLKSIRSKTSYNSNNDADAFWRKWKQEEKRKARERAQQYAKMRYEAYIKSDIYKTSEVVNTVVDSLATVLIVLMVIIMPLLLYKQFGNVAIVICAAILLPTSPLWFRFLIQSVSRQSLVRLLTFKNAPLRTKVFHFLAIVGLNLYAYFSIALNTLLELSWINTLYLIAIILGFLLSKQFKSRAQKLMFRFGYLPAIINLLFLVNYSFSHSPKTESYWYTSQIHHHRIYTTIRLDGDKYKQYKGLMFRLNYIEVKKNSAISYTFSEGLLGMRVAKNIILHESMPSE